MGQLDQLELLIKAYAAQENIEQQQYRIEQIALVNTRTDKAIAISSTFTPAALRRLRKSQPVEQRVQALKSDFVARIPQTVSPDVSMPQINPFATLSRQGIATVLGRRSKSTGQRYAKLFVQAGLLEDTPNRVPVCMATEEEYALLQKYSFNYDYTYRRTRKGVVEKVLANTLLFSLA